ncbi:hypothetical protein AB0M47_07060 [Hamadaea sp. NPDC051192]|uniref:hypothetical protein n=1 Tax=Hamadaea sp. NPDC051192 TaxID=3154940 RepID=UPI00341A45BC
MSDWEQFLDEVPWFLDPGQRVAVATAAPWSRGSMGTLPELSALLGSAWVNGNWGGAWTDGTPNRFVIQIDLPLPVRIP